MKVGKQGHNQGSIFVAYDIKGQGGKKKQSDEDEDQNVGGGRPQGIESWVTFKKQLQEAS